MLLVIMVAIWIVCMFHKCKLIIADSRILEELYYGITYLQHCILLVAWLILGEVTMAWTLIINDKVMSDIYLAM